MSTGCRCGIGDSGAEQGPLCGRCGAACCPACALSLDGVPRCRPCRDAVAEAARVAAGVGATALPARAARPRRWLIVVARNQPALYSYLLQAFARDEKVEILLDRRRDLSRNPPGVIDRLSTHGAALVRRPP